MTEADLTSETVAEAILSAWKEFKEHDLSLLIDDVNERSISHRFAICLERVITPPRWPPALQVDCEYNRDVTRPELPYSKKLTFRSEMPGKPTYEDAEAVTVFPDIIVHRRQLPENLLVIEIKKQGRNKKAEDFDKREKVPAYLNQLKYRFGVFLMLGVGNEAGTISELLVFDGPGNVENSTPR